MGSCRTGGGVTRGRLEADVVLPTGNLPWSRADRPSSAGESTTGEHGCELGDDSCVNLAEGINATKRVMYESNWLWRSNWGVVLFSEDTEVPSILLSGRAFLEYLVRLLL